MTGSFFRPFAANRVNGQDLYAEVNCLDGDFKVDVGAGQGARWFPIGDLRSFTGLDTEAAMMWTRQHAYYAASRAAIADAAPVKAEEDTDAADASGETVFDDVVAEAPRLNRDWYLSRYEVSKQNRDVTFARLENPVAGQFFQAGYEYTHYEGTKQIPVRLDGRGEEAAARLNAGESPETDAEKNGVWGGFVHVGTPKVSLRFVFDQNDVAQEAIGFELSYESLRHYLGADAPSDPVALMRLAAEKIAAEQFPKNKQFKFSSVSVLRDEEVLEAGGEERASALENADSEAKAETALIAERDHLTGSPAKMSDFRAVLGAEYTADTVARAVMTATSAESQFLTGPQDLVKVDLRTPLSLNTPKKGAQPRSPHEGVVYRVTIERPRYRGYGLNLRLKGFVRDMVAALLVEEEEKKRVAAQANALTLEDIFAASERN